MLKQLIPSSLFSRFFLILFLPTIIAQAFAIYMFYQRHWSNVSDHLAESVVGEVQVISSLINNNFHYEDQLFNLMRKSLNIEINFIKNEGKFIEIEPKEGLKSLHYKLQNTISNKFNVDYITTRKSSIRVDVASDKYIISIIFPRKRISTSTTYIFVMWMTGTASLLLILSLIFMNNQIKTISVLADAVEKFGKGQPVGEFRLQGAKEVRKAAYAFLQMKSRIERQINKRTQMLAGISHDLRTPLTRMKLQLTFLPESEDLTALQEDIREMEKMIQSYLDFARGEGQEKSESVDIKQYIEQIILSFAQHQKDIKLNINKQGNIIIRKDAMKRAISNIIDNAIRYTKSKIIIEILHQSKYTLIKINDDGPGIEEEQKSKVFRAFYRIDNARNIESGNVGLGLSVAKDIVNAHGGEITLEDSELGGLSVIISIPN